MLILGLIILLLAALFIAYVVLGADSTVALEALNIRWEMPALQLFLAGMATLAAIGLGLWLIARGTKASARKRKKQRELERQAQESRAARPVAEPAAAPREERASEVRESEVDYLLGTDERPAERGAVRTDEAYPQRTDEVYADRRPGDRL